MSEQDPAAASESTQSDSLEPRSDTPARQPNRPVRRSSWLALLAVLLSALALGASAWVWYESQSPGAELEPIVQQQTEQREQIEHLAQQLDALTAQTNEVEARGDQAVQHQQDIERELQQSRQQQATAEERLQRFSAEQEQLTAELRDQMQQLWQREGRERQIDRELELRLLLLEAASLLRIGQERAELAEDLASAREAYRRASSLIQQADDPRLGNVRRHLARELDALETAPAPDWLRAQTRLERLAEDVSDWPVATTRDPEPAPDEQPDQTDDSTGWLSSIRGAFRQLVRVRPRDELELTEEQIDTAREQVRMRLMAAELAIARRDPLELDHHLRAANRDIRTWFDAGTAPVQSALTAIESLTGLETPTLPADFGQALVALRAHLEQL